MNTTPTTELHEFHRFVGEKLQSGTDIPTLDEAYEEWRLLHPDDDRADDLDALQEAIDEIENGAEGMDIDEFNRDFCARHNIPPRP